MVQKSPLTIMIHSQFVIPMTLPIGHILKSPPLISKNKRGIK